jgi:hypothetical protein
MAVNDTKPAIIREYSDKYVEILSEYFGVPKVDILTFLIMGIVAADIGTIKDIIHQGSIVATVVKMGGEVHFPYAAVTPNTQLSFDWIVDSEEKVKDTP